MKKIPSVYVRDRKTGLYTDEVTSGCEWVLAGEGVATLKWDGTACMVRDGVLYKRYARRMKGGPLVGWVSKRAGKPAPEGWEPCEDAPDPVTGHWPGWVPVGDGPEDRWHREAFAVEFEDGTYELVGPKVQGNPHKLPVRLLRAHGDVEHPADWTRGLILRSVRHLVRTCCGAEGVVFHHPDGRMAKATRKGYGLPWPVGSDDG